MIKVVFYWQGDREGCPLETEIQVEGQVQLGDVLQILFEIYPVITLPLPALRDNDSLDEVLDVKINGVQASLNSYVVNGDLVKFKILGG